MAPRIRPLDRAKFGLIKMLDPNFRRDVKLFLEADYFNILLRPKGFSSRHSLVREKWRFSSRLGHSVKRLSFPPHGKEIGFEHVLFTLRIFTVRNMKHTWSSHGHLSPIQNHMTIIDLPLGMVGGQLSRFKWIEDDANLCFKICS